MEQDSPLSQILNFAMFAAKVFVLFFLIAGGAQVIISGVLDYHPNYTGGLIIVSAASIATLYLSYKSQYG